MLFVVFAVFRKVALVQGGIAWLVEKKEKAYEVANRRAGRVSLNCDDFILPFLHVKFCHLRNYFRFCVKKVCCGLGGNVFLFYFCTRFPALWR